MKSIKTVPLVLPGFFRWISFIFKSNQEATSNKVQLNKLVPLVQSEFFVGCICASNAQLNMVKYGDGTYVIKPLANIRFKGRMVNIAEYYQGADPLLLSESQDNIEKLTSLGMHREVFG